MFKITLAALAMAGTAHASLPAADLGTTAPLCEIIWKGGALASAVPGSARPA